MAEVTEAERILRNSGIRITRPRVEVYDYILSKRTHPTCEEIYDNLKDVNPSLSLATVYNVTERLVDEHLLLRLNSPNGERRFDGTLKMHGHLYCEVCGNVYDFDVRDDLVSDESDLVIKNIIVTASGICSDCRCD